MAINEKCLKDYPKLTFIEQTQIILKQMKEGICKICLEDGNLGTGFFCKIPFPDKQNLLPVLITNNHIIDENYINEGKNINIKRNIDKSQKQIKIKNKLIYTNHNYDVTIIEIKPNKENIDYFLELDEIVFNANYIDYIGKSIYILQYPCINDVQRAAVSYGILKNRFEDLTYNFKHYCCTEYGSSGSPILNLNNNKIIGIHKQKEDKKEYNIGSFLFKSIKEFINQHYNKMTCNNSETNMKNSDTQIYNNINSNINIYSNNNYNNNINNNINENNITNLNICQNYGTNNYNNEHEDNKYYNNINNITDNIYNGYNNYCNRILINNNNSYINYNNNISNNYNNNIGYQNNDLNNQNNISNNNNIRFNKNYYFPLKGLSDIGSTSYLNATLQCLLHSNELFAYFLDEYPNDYQNLKKKNMHVESQGNISREFYNIVKNVQSSNHNNKGNLLNCHNIFECKSFSPDQFKKILDYYNPSFRKFETNDHKDLILYLLQAIHQELNFFGENRSLPYKGSPNIFNENNTFLYFMTNYNINNFSIISSLYYGTNEIILQCQKCKKNSYIFQKFELISFNMFDYNKKVFNIYNGFEDNEKPLLLKGDNKIYCIQCKKLCEGISTCKIIQPPNKLLININYGKNKEFMPSKILFDEEIDLTKFINFNFMTKIKYRIICVLSYLRQSKTDGNYIAYCRHRLTGQWYKFNDSSCNECNANEIYTGKISLLLYERI